MHYIYQFNHLQILHFDKIVLEKYYIYIRIKESRNNYLINYCLVLIYFHNFASLLKHAVLKELISIFYGIYQDL